MKKNQAKVWKFSQPRLKIWVRGVIQKSVISLLSSFTFDHFKAMWPDSQLELFGLHNSTRNIDMQNQGDIFRGVVSINFVNFKNYRAALSKNVWVQI